MRASVKVYWSTIYSVQRCRVEGRSINALGGIPNKTQVGDMGIDGRIFPVAAAPAKRGAATGELDFMDEWYPIQVKQKDRVGRPDIDAFEDRHATAQGAYHVLRR